MREKRGVGILERHAIVVPVAVEKNESELDEIRSLAQEAKKELGYLGLDSKILSLENGEWKKETIQIFAETLAELDINPFSKPSVDKYKKVALRDARKFRINFLGKNFRISNSIVKVIFCSFCTSFIGLFVLLYGMLTESLGSTYQIVVVADIFVLVASFIFLVLTSSLSSSSLEWQKTKLSVYRGEIPEFVLRKAIQIKKATPGFLEFFVEHIGKEDPFLIVRFLEKEYYVEVWDEPKFESQLLQ